MTNSGATRKKTLDDLEQQLEEALEAPRAFSRTDLGQLAGCTGVCAYCGAGQAAYSCGLRDKILKVYSERCVAFAIAVRKQLGGR